MNFTTQLPCASGSYSRDLWKTSSRGCVHNLHNL